ncbi:glucuronate isomerase [Virgibacillus salinus]|uniref:Uronate isomerase n=1 Tax=Virgibacillus salinus TaxID=553311 RepID=A0A1H0YN34_9BACI|nr:glucuronate isomerase [Virgibacillus salinus]SDQ16627.1 D-glucuronate isomerase [Virgibacillus salinus]
MRNFLGADFLLETETAKILYHEYAKNMPIFDYHCHLTAKEIAEDKQFSTITEAWLGEDHYKWRVLRANGIAEEYITGNKSDKEKFVKWAETVPNLMGNPLFHWTYLELQRCFGIYDNLNAENAEIIWGKCNEIIQKESFSARGLISNFNVKGICTTDDPLDDLKYHQKIKDDHTFDVKVLPTFRPDGALNIHLHSFSDWVSQLEKVSEHRIKSFHEFLDALKSRIDYFHEVGCRLADHGLDSSFYREASKEEINAIFKKALRGETISEEQAIQYKTDVLIQLGKFYAEKEWAMQLHIGGLRNTNKKMVEEIGPNTGFDSIADFTYANDLANLLSQLEESDQLPKTILYNLNPRDNYMIASMAGNFQKGTPGKIQFGTAWWFNDHRDGMENQIKTLANVGVLTNFVGMLTDSRSLLSYTRHEYFRRILCNTIGNWVENGEIPNEMEWNGKVVQDISFNNICNYLNIEH